MLINSSLLVAYSELISTVSERIMSQQLGVMRDLFYCRFNNTTLIHLLRKFKLYLLKVFKIYNLRAVNFFLCPARRVAGSQKVT